MPNTLIHLAAQSLASAPLVRARRANGDWGWDWHLIWLGAMLPDLPWILQRLARTAMLRAGLGAEPTGEPLFYDLRLYASIQGSFAFCLVLSLAVSLSARRSTRVFGILALGSLVHLLLDSTQTKWANGVLLLAPLDWKILRFDWFWPEHPFVNWVSLIFLLGAMACSWSLWRSRAEEPLLRRPRRHPRRWWFSVVLLVAYLLGPALWVPELGATGAFSVADLRDERSGARVELGQAWVGTSSASPPNQLIVRTMSERQIPISPTSPLTLEPGRWSLRGRLVTGDAGLLLAVDEAHRHRRGVRNTFALLGLVAILIVWIRRVPRLF